jgi:hypothetical protein
MGLALLISRRFRNINKRLNIRHGTDPSLWAKWRGGYRSNEAWRGLVIQIAIILILALFCFAVGALSIYSLDSGSRAVQGMNPTEFVIP